MDADQDTISRVLVLGAEPQARAKIVNKLLELCGQKSVRDAAEGTHNLELKTKYYNANLELHVHAVESNEITTPLEHDAELYEAMIWAVDASSDKSFLETHQFVDNSIEELEFSVSLVVGDKASAASNSQLRRLEKWAQDSGFEFIALESRSQGNQGEDPAMRENTGMNRVLEALQCNMWASIKMVDSAASTKVPVASEDDEADTPPAKVLVLGADLTDQRSLVRALSALSSNEDGAATTSADMMEDPTHGVDVIELQTKYYTAELEVHLHRVQQNELLAPLVHDVESYEALLWVVDASSDVSFLEVKHFVEKSIEELEFSVSLVVGVGAEAATEPQLNSLEQWAQANAFEFVPLLPSGGGNQQETSSRNEAQGIGRVLEALQCNMWSSMKTLEATPSTKHTVPAIDPVPTPPIPSPPQVPTVDELPQSSTPSTSVVVEEPALEDRFQSSLAAFGMEDDDDPDMQVFAGLLSQVRRIRDTSGSLTDEERRRQAEQMAMQLWSMLGADDSDGGGSDSD